MDSINGQGEFAWFTDLCNRAYALFPFMGSWGTWMDDPAQENAIRLLDLEIAPARIHVLSIASTLISFLFLIFLLLACSLAGFHLDPACLIFFVFPFLILAYIEKYPTILLERKKTEMLGNLPAIASYLVISLRISPVLEKAVEFAAENSTGFSRKLLKQIIFDIQMGRSSSIVESMARFADEWGDIREFKAFVQLLIASTLESDERGRWMMLDSGMNVLLSGLKERTETAARNIETPVLLVFTFLVILPLVFIGLVPVLPTIGLNLSPLIIFMMYNLLLPLILYMAISFISSSKPVTMPPVEIPEPERPDIFGIPERRIKPFITLFALVFALLFVVPGALDLTAQLNDHPATYPLGTSLILLGLSGGLGLYLLGTSYRVKSFRDEIVRDEDEFTETLRQLSVLLSSGRPLPNAMAHITDLSKTKSAEIFSHAASNIQLFNVGLYDAFFGEKCGTVRKSYSKVVCSSISTIIAMSDRGSRSIASVIIRLSEHIRNMKSVDMEMKKIIGNVTSSMILIAVFVGPFVGGVASSMGYLISETLDASLLGDLGMGGLVIKSFNPEVMKLIIGLYVLETTAILAIFSDDLVYGSDKIIRRYHLGLYLPIAAVIYTVTVVVMEGVLGGLL